MNYNIKKSENITLDDSKDVRGKLLELLVELVEEFENKVFEDLMSNLSKIVKPDMYYNWYHGYDEIKYPYNDEEDNTFTYIVNTYSTFGNISTKYFGKGFDPKNVDDNIYIRVNVYVPSSMKNETIIFNIDKHTIIDNWGNDTMTIIKGSCNYMAMTCGTTIDEELTHFEKNVTGAYYASYTIISESKVSREDIRNGDMDKMPGFRLVWYYDVEIDSDAKYKDYAPNLGFRRYPFIVGNR